MSPIHKPTIVSAPGKVLIAGGYLVLDPAYAGAVLSTNARFYTCVSDGSENVPVIRVRSPQFQRAEWTYTCELPDASITDPVLVANTFRLVQCGEPNPFVALALLYSIQVAFEYLGLAKAREALSHGLDIVVLGDNDYYSHRVDGHAPSLDELKALEPFAPLACTLSEVHKTGLGSSAAMTSSFVGALLKHFNIAHTNAGQLTPVSLGLIHNVAQLAHCAAQGKIGSGFDVSASVWGHQLYRRFDPALIENLMRSPIRSRIHTLQEPGKSIEEVGEPIALLPTLDPCNTQWVPAKSSSSSSTAVEGMLSFDAFAPCLRQVKARPAPLPLPPGVQLCLADVDAGSNTRTMVGKVSEWRAKHLEQADQLYKAVGSSNSSFADGLLQLHMAHAENPGAYTHVLNALSRIPSAQWDAYNTEHTSSTCVAFLHVRNAMRSVRAGMREIGMQSGAPVEPPEMTKLLDTTIEGAPGILGGGVPGAGGYDALFILFLAPESVSLCAPVPAPPSVCEVWRNYTDMSVGPLLCGADNMNTTYSPSKHGPENKLFGIACAWANSRAGLQVVPDAAAVPGLKQRAGL